VVPDPPPLRAHPGRSADRDSPFSRPLADAGKAVVATDPRHFPFTFSGYTVRFGKTMWNVRPLGYAPDSPLWEVLGDVGAVVDLGGWWSYTTQDREADFYAVTFTSDDSVARDPTPEFVWSEVPRDFRG
jgi:hypothetical protein